MKSLCLLFLLHMTRASDNYRKMSSCVPSEQCNAQSRVLNDCNWCVCRLGKYECRERACDNVDMFGHFNDAIESINVGMEGHGSWRAGSVACEPGVHYERNGMLCICDESGKWPNPVCRDMFRVLHAVELIYDGHPHNQNCTATKLYLFSCNVCYCPSSGHIDVKFCTNMTCIDGDPTLSAEDVKGDETPSVEGNTTAATEIYAECNPDKLYSIGCRNCTCRPNNILICDDCKREGEELETEATPPLSQCSGKKAGEVFQQDCNLCYCDDDDLIYCTIRKCLYNTQQRMTSTADITGPVTGPLPKLPKHLSDCVPKVKYTEGCNICSCSESENGQKVLICTAKPCSDSPLLLIESQCVAGTVYEHDCKTCRCSSVGNVSVQSCQPDIKCAENTNISDIILHGQCEPWKRYVIDCNECRCLGTGASVVCTSRHCGLRSAIPIPVDIIPMKTENITCTRGHAFKVNCNWCFCTKFGLTCTLEQCPGEESSYEFDTRRSSSPRGILRSARGIVRRVRKPPHVALKMPQFDGRCKRGHAYQSGCNWCHCVDGFILQCSNHECNSGNLSVNDVSYVRLSKHDICSTEGFSAKDCNTCICVAGQRLKCTEAPCMDVKNVPLMRGHKCLEDASYQVDCNVCVCQDGQYVCSNINCEEREIKVHRTVIQYAKTKIKTKCPSGIRNATENLLYKKACNFCYCNDKSQYCTKTECHFEN